MAVMFNGALRFYQPVDQWSGALTFGVGNRDLGEDVASPRRKL
jgi:hypothetical protein